MTTEVIASLTRRALDAGSKSEIARLISELGHAIALRHLTAAELSALRRTVLRRRRLEQDDFKAGVWEAIAGLLSSAGAALEDSEAREALARDVRIRPGWVAILAALREQPRTPSELASLLDPGRSTDNGRVSHVLRELGQRGLVEPAPRAADGRVRPRQLSTRGYRIAAALPKPEQARGDLAVAVSNSTRETASQVVSMLRLVQVSSSVGVAELAACVGPRGSSALTLAKHVVQLSEARGLLDLHEDGTVTWGREQRRLALRKLLSSSAAELVSKAFAAVPPGFLLCTDTETVNDWRRALVAASVGVRDVCTPALAAKVVNTGDFSAVVFDDPTFREDSIMGESMSEYVARTDEHSLTLVRTHSNTNMQVMA